MNRRIVMLAKELATSLGWPDPQVYTHSGSPESGPITWFEGAVAGGAILQINTLPTPFMVCVTSPRHAIFTGWHKVPSKDRLMIQAAAYRLRPILGVEPVLDAEKRRLFRAAFPQCCRWTRSRLLSEGFPQFHELRTKD